MDPDVFAAALFKREVYEIARDGCAAISAATATDQRAAAASITATVCRTLREFCAASPNASTYLRWNVLGSNFENEAVLLAFRESPEIARELIALAMYNADELAMLARLVAKNRLAGAEMEKK